MPSNSAEYQKRYRKEYSKRRKEITVGLPIDQYNEIRSFAKAQEMHLSVAMREATMLQLRGCQMRSKAIENELKELKYLISNIANNLNQIAHHSNRVKQVSDESQVFQNLQNLEQCITNFVDTRLKEPL